MSLPSQYIVISPRAYPQPTFSPETKALPGCWSYRKYQLASLFMNVTWQLLLVEYLYAMVCIASAVWLCAEGVCLLPRDYYRTVGLNTAYIINARFCSSIPACAHFTCRARRFIQHYKQVILSLLTKLQPVPTQQLGMVQTW